MEFAKYIKAAFANRWNILYLVGGMGAAFLSGQLVVDTTLNQVFVNVVHIAEYVVNDVLQPASGLVCCQSLCQKSAEFLSCLQQAVFDRIFLDT